MVLGADILNGIGDGHIGWYWGRTYWMVLGADASDSI